MRRSIVILGAALSLALATSAGAETVVIDFTLQPTPREQQLANTPAMDELLRRFPNPHAEGKTCHAYYPNTPAKERFPNQLLPFITFVEAAVTRQAKQTAYVIDYCPTGSGMPRTRRVVVLDANKPVLDHELPAAIPASAIIAVVDIDGDGRGELVLTDTEHDKRAVKKVYLMRPTSKGLELLGSWVGVEHCSVRVPPDEVLHRITSAGPKGPFKDVATTRRCMYEPAPPRRR